MAKSVKVSRKELLKDTDQFLSSSEKAMLYFIDNRARVLGSVAVVLIIISSFFGFKYFQETKALSNEALYFEMEKNINKAAGTNPAPDAQTA